ncbi:hypothetical protein E2C01_089914 [Portunus trituberculatus]|uniref:Uncharacterized protein n=1 Tax=Portunus trituberculatus TaxID=210409 RepID=A0A5B7JEU4_PORTR|nr:hypothetical protein [Portunus trituberculatus]
MASLPSRAPSSPVPLLWPPKTLYIHGSCASTSDLTSSLYTRPAQVYTRVTSSDNTTCAHPTPRL